MSGKTKGEALAKERRAMMAVAKDLEVLEDPILRVIGGPVLVFLALRGREGEGVVVYPDGADHLGVRFLVPVGIPLP